MYKLKVAVIGGGSFGTALGTVAARCGHQVVMYTRNKSILEDVNINRRNSKFFPNEIAIPENLHATHSLEECLSQADMTIHAIPVQQTYNFLKENADKIPEEKPYIITSKGILLEQKKFFSQVWDDLFPKKKVYHTVLSGPSFAIELMKQNQTVVTVASKDHSVARYVQQNLHNSFFRAYTTDDVIGVEIGGALKNPLAIAAGMIEGSGLGINTNSALVTRGILEMSLFSKRFGGRQETLFGLSGIGDVMLTCLGGLSRNKAVGIKLAQKKTLDEILKTSKEVAEGVPTLFVLDDIMKQEKLNMPIFRILVKIVKGQITPDEGGKFLMIRELEDETQLRI